jgi:hypothetical protein
VGGDRLAEHGVAEELEPLVRLVARVLGAPRAVRQGELEQAQVRERAAEPVGETSQGVVVAGDQPSRLTT